MYVTFSCVKKTKQHINSKQDFLQVTDTAKINGVLLELIDNNGQAELKINSNKYKVSGIIKISPPFYFLRNSTKRVQDFTYKDVGVDHTLIIMGELATPQEREKFGETDRNRLCGRHMQGILLKEDSVIITNNVLKNSFVCADTGTDEKDFWGFAHN